ncbi:ankyrin repeat domain-containing protein 26-like isoform 1-T1 [Acridotheres tristis]
MLKWMCLSNSGCFRTALVVTTSHEADMEEDNLRLQEELEKVKAELREVEDKYQNSECRIENLMASVDEKEREELAAAQELQDQLSAYFENQTTVKQLEEHVKRLEIQNTSLEATVHQQSDRMEALLREMQASASLREVKEKYLNAERCIQNLKAALDEKEREGLAAAQELQDQLSAYWENQNTVKQLEEHVKRLEIENTRLEATVHEQSNRTEALLRQLQASASLLDVEEKHRNSERCIQNLKAALDEKERETTACALKLQDQLSEYLETVKQLEEHVQRLAFEKSSLEATVQQQSNRIEALQRDLQATTSAQAASQDRLEHIRVSHLASLRNQLNDRIGALECELYRIKHTQQDSTFQCAQGEVEKYKELYLKEVKIRKCQAKELERANERLEEANAKLLRKRHRSKSFISSSVVSGGLAATPVLCSAALGHCGNSSGVDRSVSLGGSFLSQCEKILSSRKRLAASVAKVQQEQEEKITKELEKATAELETGFSASSKKFHLDHNPLCRATNKYPDVLTKNYMF